MKLTTSRVGGSKCSPVYALTANTLESLSAGDGTSIIFFNDAFDKNLWTTMTMTIFANDNNFSL